MNRKLALLIPAILFTSFFALSIHIHTVEASGTIYIRANGSVDPPTAPITSADNVTYVLTANINDSVVVQRDNIVVDGADYAVQGVGSGNGISLEGRDNVTIKHITIKAFDVGVLLSSSFNNHIDANNVTANGQAGIWISGSSANNSLVGNSVTANSGLGIWFLNSASNFLSNNNVANNDAGIYLVSSTNNTLSGNTMGDNKHNFGVYGTDLSMFVQSVDTSNVVEGKPVYYIVSQSGIMISNDSYAEVGYVGLVNCTNVTVQGLDLTNNIQGLLLAYTNDSTITGNNPTNNAAGIYLWTSTNNTLSGNNLTNNDIGVATYYSDDNSIFHNSMNNPTQIDAQYSTNIWDDGYPSGGNRWSDHNGTDTYSGPYQNETGSDGLGDSNYTIDANNIDRYPLMGTYTSFNASPEQTVQTISNSTISSFAFNGTAISFNVSGETGTRGFCRICIPAALMGNTYRVFVNNTEVAFRTLPFSNNTRKYLYFNYTHSTKEVMIIPESLPFLILPLLMTTTLLALVTYKREHLPRRPPT